MDPGECNAWYCACLSCTRDWEASKEAQVQSALPGCLADSGLVAAPFLRCSERSEHPPGDTNKVQGGRKVGRETGHQDFKDGEARRVFTCMKLTLPWPWPAWAVSGNLFNDCMRISERDVESVVPDRYLSGTPSLDSRAG